MLLQFDHATRTNTDVVVREFDRLKHNVHALYSTNNKLASNATQRGLFLQKRKIKELIYTLSFFLQLVVSSLKWLRQRLHGWHDAATSSPHLTSSQHQFHLHTQNNSEMCCLHRNMCGLNIAACMYIKIFTHQLHFFSEPSGSCMLLLFCVFFDFFLCSISFPSVVH